MKQEMQGGLLTGDAKIIEDEIVSLNKNANDIITWRDMFYAHKDKSTINTNEARFQKLLNAELTTYNLADYIENIERILTLCKKYFKLN